MKYYLHLFIVSVFCHPSASRASISNIRGGDVNEDETEHPKARMLQWDELPPGLQDNPGKKLGVAFKANRGPKAQTAPAIGLNRILDLEGEAVDFDDLKPVNVFDPDFFQESADGKYVTDPETGEVIPLGVFRSENEKHSVLVTKGDDGEILDVRIEPKDPEKPPQSFTKSGDHLVGYSDEDIDLKAINRNAKFGEPDDETFGKGRGNGGDKNGGGNPNDRALFERDVIHGRDLSATVAGKTCNTWENVKVALTLDHAFYSKCEFFYPDFFSPYEFTMECGRYYTSARAQAIFAGVQEQYWIQGCIWISISKWDIESTQNKYGSLSGCDNNPNGALQSFSSEKMGRADVVRDVWHLFTGVDFTDGDTIGCAYTGGACRWFGYGVNHMTYTGNLRLQQMLFAHELGHNLGGPHVPLTTGILDDLDLQHIMEPVASPALLGFKADSINLFNNHIAAYC